MLVFLVEAWSLRRRRQDLAPLIERTFDRLHGQGDRAYAEVRQHRGWSGRDDPATTARRFWTLALGVALRDGATDVTGSAAVDEMLALLRHDGVGARAAGGHA